MLKFPIVTFFALLDCVSRASAVSRATVVFIVVDNSPFLSDHAYRQANQRQNWGKGSYPPYIQTICLFVFFSKFVILLT